jgi:hypothetical protein
MTGVVNRELALKVENVEIEALTSRLTAMKEVRGNPMGVEIERFGDATAFLVKNIPGPSFNTVKGLTGRDEDDVEKIIEFYNEREIPVRFELTPAHVSPSLLRHLNQLGFYQLDFHTSLYQTMESEIQKRRFAPEISIRELRSDEFAIFADIYTKAFNMPESLTRGVAQNNKILTNHKHWTFYLASLNNRPAGIGVLFVKDRTASLAAAATLPSLRKNGVHRALISKRIEQALLEECDVIVGQAKFGSTSQNNMERAGMRIGYTKAIWVKG